MPARTRYALAAAVVLALGAILLARLPADTFGRRAPPAVETPELAAQGKRVLTQQCWHCHREIPLAPRVAGWDAPRAYEALGRLPQLNPAMPPFRGTDADRRALAAYLAALAGGRAP